MRFNFAHAFSCMVLCLASSTSYSQRLVVNKTTFIGGNHWGCMLYDAISTPDKGVFWCGMTADSGTGDIPKVVTPFDNKTRTVIGKLDSTGKKEWVKVLTGQYDAGANGACTTSDGGYMLLTGEPNRRGDIRILRIDKAGSPLWTKTFGSSKQELVMNVIETPDKGFLILGGSQGNDGDIPFNYKDLPVAFQPFDWVLIKVDGLGNKQWVKVLGTTDDEDDGTVITDGKFYYLVGSARTSDHDCVDTVGRQNYKGASPYVIKLDTAGNVIWSKTYGGGFARHALFDPRDSTIVFAGTGAVCVFEFKDCPGRSDAFICKVDRDGKYIWSKTLGTDDYEDGMSLCPGPDKGYYVVAQTASLKHVRGENFLFLIDSGGKVVTQKLHGSTRDEFAITVLPIKNAVLSIGNSCGLRFTEGNGNNHLFPDYYTDTLSCRVNAFFSELHYWPLSVPERDKAEVLKVYPNPAHHAITVVLPESNQAAQLSITDELGRSVVNRTVQRGQRELRIETRSWQPGIYNVCLKSGQDAVPICTKVLVQ